MSTLTLGGPDLARCTRRSRRTGEPCSGPAIRADPLEWVNALDSCGHHLTPEEKARRTAEHDQLKAERAKAATAPPPPKKASERRFRPIDVEARRQRIEEQKKARTRGPGQPPVNPDGLTGDAAPVTWIYGPGQMDLIRAWAVEDGGIKAAKAVRHAVEIGLSRPFPKALVEHERNLVTGRGTRAGDGQAGDGRGSPHFKWVPGPGQLEKLEARAKELGLSRNAVTRIAVRVAERRRAK